MSQERERWAHAQAQAAAPDRPALACARLNTGRDRATLERSFHRILDQLHQLPFFVAACDHTLIGEELFAASAYLSGEPKLVGSLKGADLMKLVVVALILIGCALETAGVHGLTALLATQ